MQIDSIPLNKQSKLINDYRNNNDNIMQFFDYHPFQDYEQRVKDLKDRQFNREQLTDVLRTLNQEWDAPESTYKNIDRLKREDSVVVIGGQQAGLLTGPMYSLNKVISIIQFARKQEEELQIPVIPVFWIAGEDHDFDEINHIFLPEVPQMKKYKLLQRMLYKSSVSHINIDQLYSDQWLNRLFENLKETQFTKNLYETVKSCMDKSTTYVDFFARVIFQLFNDEGLVLIDSGHPKVREMENSHFLQLIERQPEISSGVYAAAEQLEQNGYSLAMDVEENDAHLFYHLNNERVLLTRNENGEWIGKQNEVILTTDELITIAKKQPELLSNNVVTRPLMQELLFPSLAFIGGPGEISYWAVLKPVFSAFQIKMPPVLPRLSFTYMERRVEKALNKYEISAARAINDGVADIKDSWLESKNSPPIQQIAKEIKQTIDHAHKPLRDIALDIRSDLGELAEKNLFYLQCDVEFLEERIIKALEEKYAKELNEFDLINTALRPEGGLQERMWNPLPWLNEYGSDFIKKLTKQSCSFHNVHYVVYI
ncbi:bacillithiol biosynthesis cysteine-adding enzyme BshC [Virgibacillus profundi]|uniref:Putative cysteine ligase BshC n=1 Tax=Virgibacillus profundi TaxID=2024555 RepID=A0A2A2IF26_9BACI|nr:bacillithiol biosynthesis cysteine-adding enzyme BshC [Virgibacillus profundi]PAV29906.1 bacillithiol biosynthesis cysteine-adding enzyme BshC [Virgibacillus profundi]PXY54078.1 bacillithiol biosynthesis cysteine-adding enzyme BshC [Virgibacillus profundi]